MIVDYRLYAMTDYFQTLITKADRFILGHVIVDQEGDIGVVIQHHGNGEYRADSNGNFHESQVRPATDKEIAEHRSELLTRTQYKFL